MSDLPDEVMNRAVEAASKEMLGKKITPPDHLNTLRDGIQAAVPVIVEAAVKEERERIKAVLTSEEMADLLFDLYEANEDRHRFGNLAMGAALRRAALSVIDEGKEA